MLYILDACRLPICSSHRLFNHAKPLTFEKYLFASGIVTHGIQLLVAGNCVESCRRMNRCHTLRVVIIAVNGWSPDTKLRLPHCKAPTIVPAWVVRLFSRPKVYLPSFDWAGTIHSASVSVERGTSSRQNRLAAFCLWTREVSHARVFCPTLELALGPLV